MAPLAGVVDELERDLLHVAATEGSQQGLPEREDALAGSHNTASDHNEVLTHVTVVGEATDRGDALVSGVKLGGSVVLHQLAILGVDASSDAVDLLVDLSAVMVTLLTSTGNGELHTAGVPSTNTGDLAQTLVCLAWQLLCVPTGSHTLDTTTLGDANDINDLVLAEDGVDGDGLLQVLLGPFPLVGDGAAVQLDLHDVCLLLTLAQQFHLGVSKDVHDLAVLLDLVEILLDGLLASVILPLLGGLGEGLLLGARPVLVEATAALLIEVLSPHSLEGAESTRGVDVANQTNADHGGSLDNGHSINHLLLVGL